ncbi:MAG: hypothetical protein Hyperionvirus36_21 [Hyperionvirus sp.]|uniref:Uncharacterized protein n=1 Tax=Hyperionvirus sp. TaxID=2487770 RepID=A0A3G5ADP9_9VIRU|nr:MAG: hypothetical protein Hyperionvirus36_21 [Hyperionvirus sp.]
MKTDRQVEIDRINEKFKSLMPIMEDATVEWKRKTKEWNEEIDRVKSCGGSRSELEVKGNEWRVESAEWVKRAGVWVEEIREYTRKLGELQSV